MEIETRQLFRDRVTDILAHADVPAWRLIPAKWALEDLVGEAFDTGRADYKAELQRKIAETAEEIG